jgi:hypothetical protein
MTIHGCQFKHVCVPFDLICYSLSYVTDCFLILFKICLPRVIDFLVLMHRFSLCNVGFFFQQPLLSSMTFLLIYVVSSLEKPL